MVRAWFLPQATTGPVATDHLGAVPHLGGSERDGYQPLCDASGALWDFEDAGQRLTANDTPRRTDVKSLFLPSRLLRDACTLGVWRR